MSLGGRIKTFRESLKLKQAEFAEKVSTNKTSLSFWENDKVMPEGSHVFIRMAELGVDLNWLFTGKHHTSNNAEPNVSIDFNSNLLAEIVIIVESGLSEEKLKLSPQRKSQLIIEMYKFCVVSNQAPSKDSFNKLLKMA
jgi:transcriptional regulator with XRE-family HTH domain